MTASSLDNVKIFQLLKVRERESTELAGTFSEAIIAKCPYLSMTTGLYKDCNKEYQNSLLRCYTIRTRNVKVTAA